MGHHDPSDRACRHLARSVPAVPIEPDPIKSVMEVENLDTVLAHREDLNERLPASAEPRQAADTLGPSNLTRHLPVARCIGCGARSFSAECPDGCSDVPLDLVDIDDVVAVATRAEALELRVAELRELARALAGGVRDAWPALRERARAALRLSVPAQPKVEIIEGWGCPDCGRVDAPQPCLGICIRRPGMVADASEYRQFAARSQPMDAADRELSKLAHIVAAVAPRPGREELTAATLRSRARDLLDRFGD